MDIFEFMGKAIFEDVPELLFEKLPRDALYSIDETTNIIVDNYALKKVSLVEVEGDDN